MRLQLRCMFLSAFLVILATSQSIAQNDPPPANFDAAQVLPLYSGVPAGSEKWDYAEIMLAGKTGPQVKNVVKPVLLYFPAAQSVGTAMIVAPGGGNRTLMMSYEGVDIAKKLNEVGVDAFVLKYRLIYTGPDADNKEPATTGPQAGQNVRELSGLDGRRSVELLRERAAEFHIEPNRIGMIGFSAGGGPIRAAMEGPSATRPNFAALIYAARSDGVATVPEGAPPLFLAVSADDRNTEGSVNTFLAWRAANVPAELHVFQMGAHGFVNKGGGADHFMDRVTEWIKVNGWLNARR